MAAPRVEPTGYSKRLNDRFQFDPQPVGRGTWGAIYNGLDRELRQEVSIKLLEPTPLARMQMLEREQNEDQVMLKDAASLRAAAHVLPRQFFRDDAGKGFIVMPRIDGTLEDIIRAARVDPRPSTQHSFPSLESPSDDRRYQHPQDIAGSGKPYLSGLPLSAITEYIRQILTGADELDAEFGIAHADWKAENIVYQNVRRNTKLRLTDFGTSTALDTTGTTKRSEMGSVFTRHPSLWYTGNVPNRETVNYGIANIVHYLFTGRYIDQEKIETVWNTGGARAVKEYFEPFYTDRVHARSEHENHIVTSARRAGVPPEHAKFIADMATSQLEPSYFLSKLPEITERELGKAETKVGAKSYALSFARIVTAAAVMSLGMGGMIGGCFGVLKGVDRVQMATAISFERQVRSPSPRKNTLTYIVEDLAIDTIPIFARSQKRSNTLAHYEALFEKARSENDGSIVGKLTEAWVGTADAIGSDLFNDMDWMNRYTALQNEFARSLDILGQPGDASRTVKAFLLSSMAAATVEGMDDAVRIDDAIARAYLGTNTFIDAQKLSRSVRFDDYVQARRPDGTFLIKQENRDFLNLYLARVPSLLPPGSVRVLDSSRPE